MRYLISILAILALGGQALAIELQFSPKATHEITSGDIKVPVADEATAVLPGGEKKTLHLTGYGIRVKKVVFIKIDAYALASYLLNPAGLQADPVGTVEKNDVKALRLTFLRDISGSRMLSAFQDSLKENGYDPESVTFKPLLKNLTIDVKEKQTLDILAVKKDDKTDILEFKYPDKKITTQGPGLAAAFWKIWFGKTGDGELEKLKTELIGAK